MAVVPVLYQYIAAASDLRRAHRRRARSPLLAAAARFCGIDELLAGRRSQPSSTWALSRHRTYPGATPPAPRHDSREENSRDVRRAAGWTTRWATRRVRFWRPRFFISPVTTGAAASPGASDPPASAAARSHSSGRIRTPSTARGADGQTRTGGPLAATTRRFFEGGPADVVLRRRFANAARSLSPPTASPSGDRELWPCSATRNDGSGAGLYARAADPAGRSSRSACRPYIWGDGPPQTPSPASPPKARWIHRRALSLSRCCPARAIFAAEQAPEPVSD